MPQTESNSTSTWMAQIMFSMILGGSFIFTLLVWDSVGDRIRTRDEKIDSLIENVAELQARLDIMEVNCNESK